MVKLRPYDAERDREAVQRIWLEVGWLEDDEKKMEAVDRFVAEGRALVAEVEGAAESMVLSSPGTLRYLEEELNLAGVSAVTTSRVARRQGLAGRLTARLIAEDAAAGAAVSVLGMFEQGFYNQLGFGTGPYEHWTSFDPAQLQVDVEPRIPRRITVEDAQSVHRNRLSRRRPHGAINLTSPIMTEAEMIWTKDGFGLGYYDGPRGALTHHLWFNNGNSESGPYDVWWQAFETLEQFVELLGLVRNLGDQVRKISMREPPGVQLQDFLAQPFRFRQLTEKSKYENRVNGAAYWQIRICDLQGCLERTHLPGEELRFNLELDDPIERYLDGSTEWQGLSGNYVVTLGANSGAEPGQERTLPTLQATVGAFSRLWFGVLPATSLAVSDELSGPPELLQALEQALRLPLPRLDWDF
ncbi:MAG: GNAT family N-acetyltransferase [Anaerolineales bacterium]